MPVTKRLDRFWQTRSTLVALNALAFALLIGVGLNANAAPRDCTKLTATGNPEYPPYLFREGLESKKLVGANTEIINLIAKKLGVEVKEDLAKYKGITVINNSFGQDFDEFAKRSLEIVTVPKLRQAFRVLNAERADYLLYERSPAEAYANIWGIGDSVESLGQPISSEGLYFTLSHKSECNTGELRGKLTKAVREIIDQGLADKALTQGHALWKQNNEDKGE